MIVIPFVFSPGINRGIFKLIGGFMDFKNFEGMAEKFQRDFMKEVYSHFSIKEIAAECFVTNHSVMRWATGENRIPLAQMMRLCDRMGKREINVKWD